MFDNKCTKQSSTVLCVRFAAARRRVGEFPDEARESDEEADEQRPEGARLSATRPHDRQHEDACDGECECGVDRSLSCSRCPQVSTVQYSTVGRVARRCDSSGERSGAHRRAA